MKKKFQKKNSLISFFKKWLTQISLNRYTFVNENRKDYKLFADDLKRKKVFFFYQDYSIKSFAWFFFKHF